MEIEAYLHEQIPISAAMGIAVLRADREGVELRAPLEANINHRSTVFGGSAISVAILAAWTLIHVWTQDLPGRHRIVIRRSQMEYLAPIGESFSAACTAPPAPERDRLLTSLRRHRRTRIALDARVTSGGETVATYAGVYAAIRLSAEPTS